MTITAPPTITALPTPPDPNDRATFNSRAYPWSVAQQTLADEVEAVAANVYANAQEAATVSAIAVGQTELALAASSYKGPWSSLTGPLSMPATVLHNGNFWALNANLADVTTATPGISGSWQPLNVGFGGAAEVSSAVDVTLTAASYRVQSVTMTAVDKSVILPAATSLTVGAGLFVIRNAGSIPFCIRDSAGGFLAKLAPGVNASLHLINGSAAAGVWSLTGEGFADAIYQNTALNVNAAVSANVQVTALSDTKSLAVYREGVYSSSGTLYACVLSVSGTTVTAGTPLSLGTCVSPEYIKVVALSSSQAVVVYADGSDYVTARTLDVSGTTVTAGTAAAVNATVAGTAYADLVKMTATQAVVIFCDIQAGAARAKTLNISGTTITVGASLTVATSANWTGAAAAAVSDTQLVASFGILGLSSRSALLSVSGTTLSVVGSLVDLGPERPKAAAKVSDTQVLALFVPPSPPFLCVYALFDTAGGALSVVNVMTHQFESAETSSHHMLPLSGGRVAMLFEASDASALYAGSKQGIVFLRVSDGAISHSDNFEPVKSAKLVGASQFHLGGGLSAAGAGKILAAYLQSDSYVQARVIEVTK